MLIEFYKAFEAIENDTVSGSAALADKIIHLLIKTDLLNHDKVHAIKRIEEFSRQKPFFVTLRHLCETLKNTKGDWQKNLAAYKNKYDQAPLAIANQLKSILWTHDKGVLLHSRSKTILTVFEQLVSFDREFKIYQTQSLPGKEGIIQAAELHDLGFLVEVVEDNPGERLLEDVAMFITGADLISDDYLVNKSGTKQLAEKMNRLGKPYIVLSDSRKFTSLKVENLPSSFEMIPRSLVTNVLTD